MMKWKKKGPLKNLNNIQTRYSYGVRQCHARLQRIRQSASEKGWGTLGRTSRALFPRLTEDLLYATLQKPWLTVSQRSVFAKAEVGNDLWPWSQKSPAARDTFLKVIETGSFLYLPKLLFSKKRFISFYCIYISFTEIHFIYSMKTRWVFNSIV